MSPRSDGVLRLRGVGDLPHDDGGDVDGVAVGVVDLQFVGLEVADLHRDLLFHAERLHEPQAGLADGADVGAEELQHLRVARAEHAQPGGEDGQRKGADPDEDRPQGQVLDDGLLDAQGDQSGGRDDSQQADGSGHGPGAALMHVDIRGGGKRNVGGHVESFLMMSK